MLIYITKRKINHTLIVIPLKIEKDLFLLIDHVEYKLYNNNVLFIQFLNIMK